MLHLTTHNLYDTIHNKNITNNLKINDEVIN